MGKELFAQITKVDEEKRTIYGIAAAEMPDRSGEILDYESSKSYFKAWVDDTLEASDGKSHGNLRAMHGKVAAGKLVGIEFDDVNKQFPVAAKVVDDNEWKKVLEGVYTGFSIGGSYVKKWDDKTAKKADGAALTRYTASPNELSLVDRPCIPASRFFDIQKADGAVEKVEFKAVIKDEDIEARARELAKTSGFDPDSIDNTDKEKPQPLWKTYTEAAIDQLIEASPQGDEKNAAAAGSSSVKEPSPPSSQADAQKAAASDKVEYQVEGTEDELGLLAKSMHDNKLSLKDVIAFVTDGLDLHQKVQSATALLKAEEAGEMKKGMYAISRLADLLQSLEYLTQSVKSEEEAEKDYTSVLPSKMISLLSAMGAALESMVIEEVAEMLGERPTEASPNYIALAEKCGGLEKIGARNAKTDQERIQKILDIAIELGAQVPNKEAAVITGDLQKIMESPELQKAFSELVEKATEGLQKTVVEQAARIKKLEEQPATPKGVLKVVSKGGDSVEEELPAIQPIVKDGQINEPASLIKMMHKLGGVPAGLRPDGSSVFNSTK